MFDAIPLNKSDLKAFSPNKAKEVSSSSQQNKAANSEPKRTTTEESIHVNGNSKETPNSNEDTSSPLPNTYAGDAKFAESSLEDTFRSLAFESPDELISFYDKGINSQQVVLHPWQRDVSMSLAGAHPTQQKPHKFILCACNGSGKDAFVIAPFAIWFALTKIQSRCIITSSSGVQLTSQTESYITNLARKVNESHGQEIFKIRQRYIYCRLSGSEIRLFATDEEGKAEGYHPIEPNSEMAIIINEGKSVATEIYRALRRCTGYNYWIEVSTPGAPNGDFYKHFNSANFTSRRVNTFECPHLSPDERETDKSELGEHSALYRSKHLALFTSLDSDCIISPETIEQALAKSKSGAIAVNNTGTLRVGIDIAAGGDENAIIAKRGNRIIKRLYFREKDTTITAARIDSYLREDLKLNQAHEEIFGDDGGVGKGVIDMLNSNYGWNIARVNNQSPAKDNKRFINRGAENWYRVKRILEESCWFFTEADEVDLKLLEQLGNRYYKQQSTQGRIALESKKDAKSEGRPSPDRADAFILAFTGETVNDYKGVQPEVSSGEEAPKKVNLKPEEVGEWFDNNVTYKEYEKQFNKHANARGPLSISRAVGFNKQYANRN